MLLICCGMVRSGSTLQYNLARHYLARTVGAKDLGFFSRADVEGMLDRLTQWSRRRKWYVLKCHDIPYKRLWSTDSKSVSILYVHRDVRQVGPSIRRVFGQSEAEIVSLIAQSIVVHEYIKALPNTKIQRYEQLSIEPGRCLREICQFLRVPVNDEIVEDVVEFLSTDRMQKTSAKLDRSILYRLKRKAWTLKDRVKAGNFLRRIFGASAVRQARRLIEYYDRETLLHPHHINISDGAETQEYDRLRSVICEHFELWLKENGYTSSEGEQIAQDQMRTDLAK